MYIIYSLQLLNSIYIDVLLLNLFLIAPSPRLKNAVFVLCVGGYPVGTCFAVSDKCVITALHNIRDHNSEISANIQACRSVARVEKIINFPYGRINLVPTWSDPTHDLAVLTRTDPAVFPLKIVIRGSGDLDEEFKLKCYQCPVALFNNGSISSCS